MGVILALFTVIKSIGFGTLCVSMATLLIVFDAPVTFDIYQLYNNVPLAPQIYPLQRQAIPFRV